MKKSFLGKVLMMASFVAILGGFSSCKDYSEDRYSDLLGKLEDQNSSLNDALDAQKKDLLGKISDLEAAQDACKKECAQKMQELEGKWDANLANEVAALKTVDENLQKQINDINDLIKDLMNPDNVSGTSPIVQIIENNQTVINASANAQSALDQLKVVNATTDDFEERIKALETWKTKVETLIVGWSERLTQVELDAAKALADAKANADRIDVMEELAKANGERLDSVVNALADFATKQELEAVAKKAEENYEAAKKYADDQIAILKDSVLNTIGALETSMKAADAVLASRLDSLENAVAALSTQIAANTTAINNLSDAVKKLITSVIVQGTKNPVIGSWATPFGTRSNILAAYYGYAGATGVRFPTDLPRFYADNSNVLMTAKDLEMLDVTPIRIDADEMIIGEEGNAGTLYMTVNPNTVDFSGTSFSLVNSQDEFAGVTLSGIEKSDAVLNFGFSRAANNGFYEAKATISEADINDVKLSLNLQEIKEVAQDIVNGNGVNVTNVATTVYNTLSAFNMEANGIKASWTDSEGEHSTYSQYAVAATAIKPLSYAFGKDFDYNTIPGVDRVENFINTMSDKVFDKISSMIPDFSGMSFTAPTINKISIPELDPEDCKVTFVVDIKTTVQYELNMTVPVEDVVIKDMSGETQSVIVRVPEKAHTVDVEREVEIAPGVIETIKETQVITIPAYEIEVPATNFTVDGQVVHISDVQINKLLEIPVEYTYTGEQNIYDVVNKLYGNITGSIEGVNDMLDQLDSFMGDVNNMLDELNKIKDITNKIDEAKDEIVSQLTKYLDKFNNKFCNLINSTNDALQPVMFVKTTDGFSKLSQVKAAPTMFSNGSVTLIPTSYTAEILAPAYKKLVGVTNVFKGSASAQAGNSECVAALKKVNDQIAEILPGDTYTVAATFEAGYVYEVVYTAVDFHGMVNTKKFYVTVK